MSRLSTFPDATTMYFIHDVEDLQGHFHGHTLARRRLPDDRPELRRAAFRAGEANWSRAEAAAAVTTLGLDHPLLAECVCQLLDDERAC